MSQSFGTLADPHHSEARRSDLQSAVCGRLRTLRTCWARVVLWCMLFGLMPLLLGCFVGRERREAAACLERGDLGSAHRILVQLVHDSEHPPDRVQLRRVERQLAEQHYDRAEDWLRRGFPEKAYDEFAHCLRYDPQHVAARARASAIASDYERLQSWRQQYCQAVEEERWQDALALIVAPQGPYFQHRYYGNVDQYLTRSWDALLTDLAASEQRLDEQSTRAGLQRAESFLEEYAELLGGNVNRLHEELSVWRDRADQRARIDALVRRAQDRAQTGQPRDGMDLLSEALFWDPQRPELRKLLREHRDLWVEQCQSRLRQAYQAKQWDLALAAAATLERLGAMDDELERHQLPSLRELRVQELLEEARSHERQGWVGAALRSVSQALDADPSSAAAQRELTRLRGILRARPLVATDAAAAREEHDSAPVIVEALTPEYRERRAAGLKRQWEELRPDGIEQEDNPSYIEEHRRWVAARDRTQRLYRVWQDAGSFDRDMARSRYEMAAAGLERIRQRLQQLAPRERRARWRAESRDTQTRQLRAELLIPLRIHRAGTGWSEHTIAADLTLSDRTQRGDATRSLPDDPDELPGQSQARSRLEAQCQAQMRHYLRELEVEARLWLLREAEACLERDERQPALEYAVWALLSAPQDLDPLRRQAASLLADHLEYPLEWTQGL